MNSTHAANTTRLVALAAALLVTAAEWTGFSEIFLLAGPTPVASVAAADAAPYRVLPEGVVTAHARS
ncbi:MAG: hypothetical protein WA747_10505 [Steroidobacteraceae bacterium]